MTTQRSQSLIPLLICGITGCILMGASDWLMIYGNPTYEGTLAWLTNGVAQIAPWRNALAMFLAFPAVLLYAAALLGLRHALTEPIHQKIYTALTILGMTPWLCLHLFYGMILYVFSWFCSHEDPGTGHAIGEAIVQQFSWLVLLGQLIMILPFLFWFLAIIRKQSIFSQSMALCNPLIFYIILKGITFILPDSPFKLAFTNGLMSESMLIWFLVLIVSITSLTKKHLSIAQ